MATNQSSHDDYPVTEHSVAAAKAATAAERAEVTRRTGIVITESGATLPPEKPHKVACGLCNYTAHAHRYGQAVNSVAAHIVGIHFPQHRLSLVKGLAS